MKIDFADFIETVRDNEGVIIITILVILFSFLFGCYNAKIEKESIELIEYKIDSAYQQGINDCAGNLN